MSVNFSIPEDLARRLRRRAERNQRSLEHEVLAILEQESGEVTSNPMTVDELARRVRDSGLRTASESAEIVREARDAR